MVFSLIMLGLFLLALVLETRVFDEVDLMWTFISGLALIVTFVMELVYKIWIC